MRELKFRAWNMLTKTMIDLKKCTPLALNMDTDGLFIPFSGMPIMQFTGLHDCEGKEIYEGDILRIIGKGEMQHLSDKAFLIDDEFCFDVTYLKSITEIDKDADIKVIGNIYENPELVK